MFYQGAKYQVNNFFFVIVGDLLFLLQFPWVSILPSSTLRILLFSKVDLRLLTAEVSQKYRWLSTYGTTSIFVDIN